MRVVVYDSGRCLESAHVLGGEGATVGDSIKMSVNAVVFGDTRVDFFLHKKREGISDSNRKLAFFVCFNTAFYESESELVFRKNKVHVWHLMHVCMCGYIHTHTLSLSHTPTNSHTHTLTHTRRT